MYCRHSLITVTFTFLLLIQTFACAQDTQNTCADAITEFADNYRGCKPSIPDYITTKPEFEKYFQMMCARNCDWNAIGEAADHLSSVCKANTTALGTAS